MNQALTEHFNEYAIFATGGKQYQGIPGKTVAVELLEGQAGDKVTFDTVLLRKQGADKIEIGTPFVAGAKMTATIVKQMRGPKITIFKFRRRKKYRVKTGHRQSLTVLRVDAI
jgi:large subunit ribosomal protein L21